MQVFIAFSITRLHMLVLKTIKFQVIMFWWWRFMKKEHDVVVDMFRLSMYLFLSVSNKDTHKINAQPN